MTMPRFEPLSATPVTSILTSLSLFLARVRDDYLHHREMKNDRAAFMHMATLDDSTLDDIGVTREDIAWAASLPLDVNAAQAVRARARQRRYGTGRQVPDNQPTPFAKIGGATALEHLPPVVAARWFYSEQKSDID